MKIFPSIKRIWLDSLEKLDGIDNGHFFSKDKLHKNNLKLDRR